MFLVQRCERVERSVTVADPDKGQRDLGLANDSRDVAGVNKAVVRLVLGADTGRGWVFFPVIRAGRKHHLMIATALATARDRIVTHGRRQGGMDSKSARVRTISNPFCRNSKRRS